MSKGLKLTLATVAVVLMGMSAMATAPVISEIPSPIVGGGETTTPPNLFVYPDAINLNQYVEDDGGKANIVWSYEVAGTQIYSINGNDPIDSASEDPTDPAAVGKDLNTVRNSEIDDDGSALSKITVRNVNLSPIGGPNTDPGTEEGILSSETQVVTLYASDGSTYSQTEVMFYTDNEGPDALSPGGYEVVDERDFINDPNDYSSGTLGGAAVTVTDDGICIDVPAGGNNIGTWTSPYRSFEMEGNSVYRIRTTMNSSQTTAGLVPLWDVIVQNFDGATQGAYAYLADFLILDNEGGAYAVGPTGGISGVDIYFVPLPVNLPSWNDPSTGAFATVNDDKNDIQLIFRVLDADETANYGGELDTGQICIDTLTIERIPIADVVEGATVLDLAMNETNYRGYDLVGSTDFDWTTVADQVTIGPTDGNFETEISYIEPGDGDIYDPGGEAEDDFPIVWEADTIYMIEMDVSAPAASDETDPVDVIQVAMDPPTWENFVLNSVTRGDTTMHNLGMPKSGSTQTYVTFLNSPNVSLTGVADFKRLRPRVQILNSTALSYDQQANNTGSFTIHGITVKKVTIP
jgi:hypothetical protein